MTIGTLIKITANKKLMMKISESAYDSIDARLTAESYKKGFPTNRLATFSLDDDDGKENHFVMISLDKYDKQNMRKFEQLLKKDVAVQYRFKPYDFIPDGEDEQRCGINLELVSIRQIKQQNARVLPVDEIDEIADKAAARACCRLSACLPVVLNAEEQAIDEDVEKAVAKNVNAQTGVLHIRNSHIINSQINKLNEEVQLMGGRSSIPQKEYEAKKKEHRILVEAWEKQVRLEENESMPIAPPKLERQMAMGGPIAAATHRRRRVQPSEESLAAADYQTPEEIKAFAVIDAFEQEE